TKAPYLRYPNVEDLSYYRPGGFHPVHLNDTFKDDRYTVVHKLGYGKYATVWLVKDADTGKYASLKILASNARQSSAEIEVLTRLRASCDGQEEGQGFVMQMLDHFKHERPNGVHLCIVTEVLGPSLSEDLEDLYPDECLPPNIVRRLITQIGLGVKFLHSRGVVHGSELLLLFRIAVTYWTIVQTYILETFCFTLPP
ncbi:kinase-like domain-containing protein, partial [Mycena capillaripes]